MSTKMMKNVLFSHNDIRRRIKIPPKITPKLAYFCGVMCGDGCINNYIKSKYWIFCGGNPNDEREYYDFLIKPLMKDLFNLDVEMKYLAGGSGGNNGVYGFKFGSKALFTFLTDVIKLPKGKKYDKLKIPDLFKRDDRLVLNFIRGIFDTDGGFVLKKRYKPVPYYPVISFSSKNENFVSDIRSILISYGLNPAKYYKMVQVDERMKNGKTTRYLFEINGHLELYKWIHIIGFRQPKSIRKLELWIRNNLDNKKAINKIKKIAGEGFEFGGKLLSNTNLLRPPGVSALNSVRKLMSLSQDDQICLKRLSTSTPNCSIPLL